MKLWGGRFTADTAANMKRFGDSIRFDQALYAADIQGSMAYARALAQAGVITDEECSQLLEGLLQVQAEFDAGTFEIKANDEDIHTAVERRLGELNGAVAGKLHTGRSRNDQVATDLRLYLMTVITGMDTLLVKLQTAIVDQAEAQLDAIMPGYTHMQQAQPVRFSHWLMAFFWKFQRDRERLASVHRETASLPLGAGALAGNPLVIDRRALADDLGFDRVADNSMDAISDRDYVAAFLAWAALVQIHISSLAEDLIIWSSREFGFVEVSDAYATGSSLMPQKKNPDSLELMRGKSGRVVGHLTGLLTTLKGLPSTYNKDLQEDKEALFDTIETLTLELPVTVGVIQTLSVHKERMAAALEEGILATDLADYLVRRGIPFRESHHLVGQAVRQAEASGVPLSALELETYQAIHPVFAEDVYEVFNFERSVEARSVAGGTAAAAVLAQIDKAKKCLA